MENLKPTESLRKTPQEYRRFFEGEGDKKTFFWVEGLRSQVESLPDWIETKEKAKYELEEVPQDIIPRIFERLDPYVSLIPVGHSQGHVYRDFITSMVNLRDPELKKIDDVEKMIGILAGTFHDIGNSVVNRYEEPKRFSGHAEVGAYLFGELSEDLIPPNLLKLTQYAIAAHTHYTKEMPVTKKEGEKEETLVKRPYEDKVVDGNRLGIWLARGADRVDAQGIQMVARHSMVKAEPTEDYDPDSGFHKIRKDEIEDFKHQFNPVLRDETYRNSLTPEEKTRNLLEHIKMYRDSALEKTVYSQHDSEYFRETFIVPAAEEQMEFVEAVLGETENLTDQEINDAFQGFYKICRIVEPGKDIENVIGLLDKKFSTISREDRSHWAQGYRVLANLYNRWYGRIEGKLSEDFADHFSPRTKEVLEKGNELAKIKLKDFRLES